MHLLPYWPGSSHPPSDRQALKVTLEGRLLGWHLQDPASSFRCAHSPSLLADFSQPRSQKREHMPSHLPRQSPAICTSPSVSEDSARTFRRATWCYLSSRAGSCCSHQSHCTGTRISLLLGQGPRKGGQSCPRVLEIPAAPCLAKGFLSMHCHRLGPGNTNGHSVNKFPDLVCGSFWISTIGRTSQELDTFWPGTWRRQFSARLPTLGRSLSIPWDVSWRTLPSFRGS